MHEIIYRGKWNSIESEQNIYLLKQYPKTMYWILQCWMKINDFFTLKHQILLSFIDFSAEQFLYQLLHHFLIIEQNWILEWKWNEKNYRSQLLIGHCRKLKFWISRYSNIQTWHVHPRPYLSVALHLLTTYPKYGWKLHGNLKV